MGEIKHRLRIIEGRPWKQALLATVRLGLTGGLIITGLLAAPAALATPGQCWNSPFGGFCDELPDADGSFRHCEYTGFGSSSYRNCYQACLDAGGRLYPTDYDFDTPC